MFNRIEKGDLSLSIRNGLNMPFLYKGQQVVVHNASWSFREKIWINDELVVNQLGFSMESTHTIEVAGDLLVVRFGCRDGMRTVFLEVRAGDTLVHEVHQTLANKMHPAKLVLFTALFAALGAAMGYGAANLVEMLFGGA